MQEEDRRQADEGSTVSNPSSRSRAQVSRTELVGELLWLRQQLEALAASPVVVGAHQLTTEVAPVLEPVWSILAKPDGAVGGVGFLRQFGIPDPKREAADINAAVAMQAVETYQGLELITPSTRDVWKSLACPARALLESVSDGQRFKVATEPASVPHAATLGPTVRPILPRGLLGSWEHETTVIPALRRVLRRWCDLARHAAGERREVARLTLAAALLARGAALDGDIPTVKWFIDRWLGLRPTENRVEGASAALLEDGWTHPTVDDAFSAVRDAVTDLRIEALYQHRLHRPVWETQLRGSSVALLSEPAGWQRSDNGFVEIELADTLVTGFEAVTSAGEYAVLQEILQHVLNTISEQERTVIWLSVTGYSNAEIMRKLGLTRYRVDRVLSRTLSKLRHPSRSQRMRDFLDMWD